MGNLELTVSREQVTSFLRDGFEDYFYDSQRDGPTGGIDNYAYNLLGIVQRVRDWRGILPLPNEVRDYFGNVSILGGHFEWSLSGIVGSNPHINKEENANEHYDSLVKLIEIYNTGLELEQKNLDIPELKTLNVHLRQQIIISNIIFNPEKRDWKFQRLIWEDPKEFNRSIGDCKY